MDEKMEGVLGHGVLGSIDGVCSEKATAVLRPLLGDTILGPGQRAAVSSPAPFVGLYFSAAWCGPCRGFTPQLAKWYSESAGRDLLEIVFVSSDSDDSVSTTGRCPGSRCPSARTRAMRSRKGKATL